MVTAKINDKAVVIPERFTVSEWVELQQLGFDSSQQWPLILEKVTGVDALQFKEADEEAVELFMSFISVAMNERKAVELPDFNGINFGQFVDLDCYISLGIEKHLQIMLDVLEVDTPWAPNALYIIESYIKWRTSIYRKYKDLFGLKDTDFQPGAEGDAEDFNPMDVSRNWYTIIVELAGEDILKMDRVTEEPLEKVLTFLQIKKEKALKEAQEARNKRLRKA